jgi:hypothetical protein
MLKRLAHLVTGIALLSISAYFFLGAAHGWKNSWRQVLSPKSHPAARQVESAKSGSTSVDPIPSAENLDAETLEMYAAQDKTREAADRNDAVSRETDTSPSAFEHLAPVPSGPNQFLHSRAPTHE